VRISTTFAMGMLAMWVVLIDARIAHGIVLDQVDDFEDGTPQAWEEGVISPNPPVNVSDGGPGGVGDNYLRNSANGGVGAGSRQVMFNSLQWTGDYLASGVTVIEADMANFGASALSMRIAIQDGLGSRFGSTLSVALPADSVWHSVAFPMRETDLTLISGTSTVESALSDVIQLRMLAAASAPAWEGQPIASTLGIDNIGPQRCVQAIAPETAPAPPMHAFATRVGRATTVRWWPHRYRPSRDGRW
jgi:hypothetical protein